MLQKEDVLRKQFGMDGGKWKELWNELDADGDGKITEEELIAFLMQKYEDGTLKVDDEEDDAQSEQPQPRAVNQSESPSLASTSSGADVHHSHATGQVCLPHVSS